MCYIHHAADVATSSKKALMCAILLVRPCYQIRTARQVEGTMEPARTAILRLYDYLATQITLDFTTGTPHIFGCNGTLRHASAWIASADSTPEDTWQIWFRAMCIDCDCALLLQLNTMAAENGA